MFRFITNPLFDRSHDGIEGIYIFLPLHSMVNLFLIDILDGVSLPL